MKKKKPWEYEIIEVNPDAVDWATYTVIAFLLSILSDKQRLTVFKQLADEFNVELVFEDKG